MKPDEQAIRARCEAAQEGPWTWDVDREVIVGPAGTAVVTGQDDDGMECGLSLHPQNSELLTHARQDIPWLLKMLDELRDKAERLRHRCDLYELAWARLGTHEQTELQSQHNADTAKGGNDDD